MTPIKNRRWQDGVKSLLRQARWREAWAGSLHFRLVALGLMPLLIAFPLVIAVLLVVGGERVESLMLSNLRSNLGGAQSYLNQLQVETGVRVSQMVRSERLTQFVRDGNIHELNQVLATAAKGSGLDYLVVAGSDGRVIGSSTGGVTKGLRLPQSYVVRQAITGVANTAFERIAADRLAALSPALPALARIDEPAGSAAPVQLEDGLLINAAAHFPLMVNNVDAILVGGILLNKNLSLIEHLREILFPVGALPGDAEGMTALFFDATSIAISRQKQQGVRNIGMRAAPGVEQAVLGQGDLWLGRETYGEASYLVGYAPLLDGEGQRVGMIGAGFPDAPYRRTAWVVLGMIAMLLALTMLAISALFLRTGRELTRRLAVISRTMEMVRMGDRDARAADPARNDELGRLTLDFNGLLDTIAAQDEVRRQDEAKLEEYRHGLEVLVEHRTRELNERSEQLNAIFTLSPDGFVSFDGQRRIMFANRAFLVMTGMRDDEVIGLDEEGFSARLAARCRPEACFEGVAALRAGHLLRNAGETVGESAERQHVFELSGPGGRVLDVGIRLSATGNVSQILYFSDVTHETEVDRMKSEFLAAAAHELRTPMASIYGFAELLLAQDFDEEMRREVVTTIFKQSELMASIINELLDLARIESRRGKDFMLEPAVLQDIVLEVVSGYKPPDDRSSPRVPETDAPLPIHVDRKKIQQALLNVLSNAYKYSPQGGEVGIAYRHEDGRVGVEVSDRGIGMTPEQCSRVFERFYRADDSGTILGTGLGMSIVKEIVELHGGRVDVRSAFGEGTAVTLWLPASG